MKGEATVTIAPLADHPDAVGRIAGWYHDQWHRDAPEGMRQRIAGQVARGTAGEVIPYQFVAVHGGEVVATAALVPHEIKRFVEREVWLGGVYVDAAWRGRGLAQRLVRHGLQQAALRGLDELWLQTERLDGGLYARLGFVPMERLVEHGRTVRVLRAVPVAQPIANPLLQHM